MSFNARNISSVRSGFEYKCLFVLIESYHIMNASRSFDPSWKENKFTQTLVSHIKGSELSKKWELNTVREYYLDGLLTEDDPDKTPRIDLQFSNWTNHVNFEYFVEFKNLSEKDWTKSTGAKVKANALIKRYVTTGIEHFSSGYYPPNGCLCGYVTQGNTEGIVSKLNAILIENSFNTLDRTEPINNHNLIYKIQFQKFHLKNIFFEFQNDNTLTQFIE